MSKKMRNNIIMVAIIVVIAVSGVLGVGALQGWFEKDDGTKATITDIVGVVNMERDGVLYPIDSQTVLREGDKISLGLGATASIKAGNTVVILGEKADAAITDPFLENLQIELSGGEAFVNANNSVALGFGEKQALVENAVALFSIRKGAQSISVFSGKVEKADKGQMLEYINGEESLSELYINSLNSFTILQLRKVNAVNGTYFTNEQLDKLEAERKAKMEEQANQSMAQENASQNSSESAESSKTVGSSAASSSVSASGSASSSHAKPSASSTAGSSASAKPSQSTSVSQSSIASGNSSVSQSSSASQSASQNVPAGPIGTCEITVECTSILNNMDKLDPAKTGFVPSNGYILSASVDIYSGDTAFDILQKVCDAYGIQLEYSWSGVYGSNYIEGINNLYEFDCGEGSGWVYLVNGWSPNYGVSGYEVEDGDYITFSYTCG